MNSFLILRNLEMSNQPITIKSLGRMASLGSLYDARCENFLDYYLLRKDFPQSLIDEKDQASSKFKYDYTNTHESKFHNLDVSAELKLSVLSGMVSLEGSGKYLNEKKENHKSVRGDLVYDITTKSQKLRLSDVNDEVISHESIKSNALTGATHVVTGIQWGASVIASFEYTNDENRDRTAISGNLKAIIEKLKDAVSAKADAGFTEEQNSLKSKLSIKFYGDVVINGKVPQSYEEVLVIIADIQNLIAKSNDGKGIQIFKNILFFYSG
jgi:hypothetical protein